MSALARLSRQRNWLKLRLMGCITIFYNSYGMTPEELEHAALIRKEIKQFLDNFNDNSKKFGIKPKEQIK